FSLLHPSLPPLLFPTLPPRPPRSTPLPYTTLFRSSIKRDLAARLARINGLVQPPASADEQARVDFELARLASAFGEGFAIVPRLDRKSTRLNSSHEWISYAVFCLKKKNSYSYEGSM